LTAGRAGPAFTTRERSGWSTYRASGDVPGQLGLVNVFRPPEQTRIKRRQVLGGVINDYERAAKKPKSRPVAELWNRTG
jgi:hypothetical protein